MGRIEDTVRKLKGAGRLPPSNVQPPSPNPARLGTVVPPTTAYEGKHIAVDLGQLRLNELLAPDIDSRRIAEQYRAIKRPLLRNAVTRRQPAAVERGNLLMIASALPGEGKTFTCVNLCLSIAREKDWQVVLVDADCSKPHLTRLFSLEQEPGLLDLLRNPKAAFDSFVMPTDIPGLSILPAGGDDGDASELLASKRMDDLCAALAVAGTDRMIVFDSSPLLLTSEAVALATHVGQIALVVRASETPRPAVLAALDKLDSEKAIGLILNRAYGTGLGLESDGYGYPDYGN
jgi:receptor protein-tyrosine kinase